MGSYLMPSLYVLQLRHWLRAFNLDQFHIMSSKAFKVDTGVEMMKLAAFLEGRRGLNLASAARANEKVLEGRHRTKKVATNKASALLTNRTATSLAIFFEPFNAELWELIGRKVDW